MPELTTCEADPTALYDLPTRPATGAVDSKKAMLVLGGQTTTLNIRRALTELPHTHRFHPSRVFSGHGTKDGDEALWVTQDTEFNAIRAHCLTDWDTSRRLRAGDASVIMRRRVADAAWITDGVPERARPQA